MKKIQLNTTIPPEMAGFRLDQALAQLLPEHSRSRIQDWIEQQVVRVNGAFWRCRDKVKGDEQIEINATLEPEANWSAQNIHLDIRFEDEHILVVNKPVGLVTHPAPGHLDSTLVNALVHYAPELELLPRAGLIHRLDKDTSGLLLVAKTLTAHTKLIKQLQARQIERMYDAVVRGVMISGGIINEPIGRHATQRTKMAVTERGKPAVTHYRVVEKFRFHTWVQVKLETGRTHQIRVHLAFMQYPLVGDSVYSRLQIPGQAQSALRDYLRTFNHQALHAKSLAFQHPVIRETVQCSAEMPADMQQLIELLRQDAVSNDKI